MAVPISGVFPLTPVSPVLTTCVTTTFGASWLPAVEDVPPAYIAQLALYRALVQRIYPGRAVRGLVLWTVAPRLMELPQATLDAALKNILTD